MSRQPTNPLFHDRTLNAAIRAFTFPADLPERQGKILQWIDVLQSGTLDEIKETSLHGSFLADIFQAILGYRSVIAGGGQAWEIHAEQTISDGGGSADGALGFFTATVQAKGGVKLSGRVIAPIELKGAKDDLDRVAPGRKESAVDQGWRYANYTPDCKWVIVSNYREIRLYQTSKTPAYCEIFRLLDLGEMEAFQRFYFLLCRENFLPNQPQARSRIDELLAESNEAEAAITNALYEQYKQVRVDLAQHFQATAPNDIENRDTVLIEKAQKVLDRVLFIAFCEDRGLLPDKTIQKAYEHRDPYNPRPIWENYKAIFRWVDQGNEDPPIPGYNGGLFKLDSLLDEQLQVTDQLCGQLKDLTRFDFDTEVSVNILGHIFEQSVSDLEELKALAAGQSFNQKQGKRKTQGVYYTPAFITQYIVEVALGGYLRQKEAVLSQQLGLDTIPKQATKKRRDTEVKFWEDYRDILLKTRVIDPACGSGAFLIAAFDYLNREYERVNEALAALAVDQQSKGKVAADVVGQRSLFDLDETILNKNLFGVDLWPESVEITKLSLWLKTAKKEKALTYLDDNIKVGNSIVSDPSYDPLAFNWLAAFPDVFADGGFDVVLGNPPYVRQERLTPFKPYLQTHYQTFDGVADLYVYFYEQGLRILKPEGVLSYIVTNKWFKAGYGEALRRFFTENSIFEQILDFGHAPIFPDAEVFPCIVSMRKPETVNHPASTVRVCPVPREKLPEISLPQYVQQEGFDIPWTRFTEQAWSLEPPEVDALMQKIQSVGIPLKEYVGHSPYYGIKTGLNEAFLIDNATKNKLVNLDPKSVEIIKPYLRGQDVKRWNPDWQNLWMILAHKEIQIENYPIVREHLTQYGEKLEKRAGKQLWWQLQAPPSSTDLFEQPKIIWPDLAWGAKFCFDYNNFYTNDLCFILPTNNLWLLAVINSPLIWAWLWRNAAHGKDEVLRLKNIYTETLPIPPTTDEIKSQIEPKVSRLIELTKQNQASHREVYDWLQTEQAILKLGQKLENFANLDGDQFVQEVRIRKPKGTSLNPKALKELRDVYQDYAPQIQARNAEALTLEIQLSDLVNQAYGLTPEEIDLMWKTAPPRMPIPRPI
ncbi:Eco57I restriction-modification methylase domain-containing protein [Synechococcus sp. PCC 6312]|uniref:Eco57I restriction-modification methylase domain-containing protein n=1 Tax=Synechococcus sp. (strain ATCC 27167 / PCC 6312) TaxID=195253 RepID=UPI00029EF48E|nr:DNA methyltransferase [Synechococcus sp. PCC 6312]AFY59272.1 type I restriction-modification system methyltransferase subunit [Synechococcus sp. PCC 6312]